MSVQAVVFGAGRHGSATRARGAPEVQAGAWHRHGPASRNGLSASAGGRAASTAKLDLAGRTDLLTPEQPAPSPAAGMKGSTVGDTQHLKNG